MNIIITLLWWMVINVIGAMWLFNRIIVYDMKPRLYLYFIFPLALGIYHLTEYYEKHTSIKENINKVFFKTK